MHNIILILIPSKCLILLSGACSSYHILGPKLFILFSGAPSYFNYTIPKLHLIHRRPWILFFSSFTSHAFITGVLHGGSSSFNSSSKSSSRFLFELKHSSSCIWIAILSPLSFQVVLWHYWQFLHVSWFTSYQEWDM